jgi:hypothetical protein
MGGMPYPNSLEQMFLHGAHFVWRVLIHYTGSISSNILGYFAPFVAIVLLFTAAHYREFSHPSSLFRQVAASLKTGGKPWFILVYSLIFAWAAISEAWSDHYSRVTLQAQYNQLADQLKHKRQMLDTNDPAFGNIIYLLQAFDIYRHARQGVPCFIRVTAPVPRSDSAGLASAFAQFSNSVSDCSTSGPDMLFELNPDLEKEAKGGMVADAIVFHAAKDDKAADQIFTALGNQIRLVRSYELPAKPVMKVRNQDLPITIWLQFGTDVRWNSELIVPRH